MYKLSRNESCPCGSGKKYKNCCIIFNDNPADNIFTLDKESLCAKYDYFVSRNYQMSNSKAFYKRMTIYKDELHKRNLSEQELLYFSGLDIMALSSILKKYHIDDGVDELNNIDIANIEKEIQDCINIGDQIDKSDSGLNEAKIMFYKLSDNYIGILNAIQILITNKHKNKDMHLEYVINEDSNKIDLSTISLLEDICMLNLTDVHIIEGICIKMMNHGFVQNAYSILKKSKAVIGHAYLLFPLLSFCCNILGATEESIKLCDEGLNIVSNHKKNDLLTDVKRSLSSNLAQAYFLSNQYKKGIEYLNPIVKDTPNNIDLSNLANAFLREGKYDDAILACRKAMFISEDETEYFIMGEAYYYKREYETGIQWYKKALAFMHNESLNYNYIENGKPVKSICLEPKLITEKIYQNLMECYIEAGFPKEALVLYEISKEDIIDKGLLNKIKRRAEQVASLMLNKQGLEIEVKAYENELVDIKMKYQSIIKKFKEYAIEIINLQEGFSSYVELIDLEDNDKFVAFLDKLHDISRELKMKEVSNEKYSELKNLYSQQYDGFLEVSIDFLTTAEILYNTLSSTIMDFAPIIVEYCKAVEKELRVRVSTRDKTKKISDENLMLRKIYNLLFTNEWFPSNEFKENFLEIIIIRNNCAHTGFADSKIVSRMREILFNCNLLNEIANL